MYSKLQSSLSYDTHYAPAAPRRYVPLHDRTRPSTLRPALERISRISKGGSTICGIHRARIHLLNKEYRRDACGEV